MIRCRKVSFVSAMRLLLLSRSIQALDAATQSQCIWVGGRDTHLPCDVMSQPPLASQNEGLQSSKAATKLYLCAPKVAPQAVRRLKVTLKALETEVGALHELLASNLPTFVRSTHVDVPCHALRGSESKKGLGESQPGDEPRELLQGL